MVSVETMRSKKFHFFLHESVVSQLSEAASGEGEAGGGVRLRAGKLR